MVLTLHVREVDYSGKKPKIYFLGEIVVPEQVIDFIFGTNRQTKAFIRSIDKYSFLKHEQFIISKAPSGHGYLISTKNFQNTFLRRQINVLITKFVSEQNLPQFKNIGISRGDLIVIKSKETLKRKEYDGIEIIIQVVST